MQTAKWIVLAGLLACAAGPVTANDGLGTEAADRAWPRWQARIALGVTPAAWRLDNGQFNASSARLSGLSVLGDYFFSARPTAARSDASSGFRATSGLIVGSRSSTYLFNPMRNDGAAGLSVRSFGTGLRPTGSSADVSNESGAAPYVGVGYTGASVKGGWGFSADIGLMALNPGSAIKLGRVLGGGQSLDETLREMRLSPLLHLGVSYSF